jgi:cytochrome oxidase Cu insertion factor (SCO1/SenC/PrrC family)
MQKVVVPIITLVCLGVLGFVLYLFMSDPGQGRGQQAVVAPGKAPVKQPAPRAEPGPKVGDEAKDISGEDVDGKAFKLSDYRGKVVVLDFWGFW